MTYTAQQLITKAFFISGIAGHDFQTVTGPQLAYGLGALNDIIDDKQIETDMIPYTTTLYDFNSVPGQEMYFIPGLVQVDTLCFFIDTIRYSMSEVGRDVYFGSSRANNIDSLPVTFHAERCFNGTNIFLYFYPNIAYPMQLLGLFKLNEVTFNQDLSLTIERFYINYLGYSLANRLCIEYGYTIPQDVKMQLEWYEMNISKRSAPMDLKAKTINMFAPGNTISYAQVNLGGGFIAVGGAFG